MIYFDSAATTAPFASAIEAANRAFECFGNPSSLHSAGINAKMMLEGSRKTVAAALYCKPEEVIFTGGGSESNNQAIFGLAKLRIRRSKRIITTDSEHPSVANPLSRLESEGFEIIRIPTVGGALDIPFLENALKDGAAFVTVMLANNETGAKYDLAAVRRAIDRSGCGALLHCDAVQGFLKVKNPREISKYCDLASISAHKIGGIKGVGALYCKSGVKLQPLIFGGGQEKNLRSGTENVAGIAAFAAACEEFPKHLPHITALYERAVALLSEHPEKIKLNRPESHIDSILSISVKGIRSEVLLNTLDLKGICISAGSACSARRGPGAALTAYGLSKEDIDSTVRISFGAFNTLEEVEALVSALI
ncbi:MAG: cysteine desulfurase [Clostridia bacterium]|nr:cysteine desulfurase [Clostridia bacterium]